MFTNEFGVSYVTLVLDPALTYSNNPIQKLLVLCLSPQNIIDPNHHQEIQFEEEVSENDNQEHFQCHEVKNDWDKHLAHSKFAIQGAFLP